MEQKSKIQEKPNAVPLEFKGGEIEFRNVQYSYPKDEKENEILLNGLSFKI